MSEASEEENKLAQEGELQEVMLREQERCAELKEYLSQLVKENSDSKKKYKNLQQRLSGLNELLQKNTRIFQQLFDDTKGALQMGNFTTLNNSSPPPQSESRLQNVKEPLEKINSLPGPSGVVTTRSKMNIGRLDLKQLAKSLEDVVNESSLNLENGTESTESIDRLTTIAEENTQITSTEGALAQAKDVRVRLSRLPYDIVQEHLHKYETVESSVDMTTLDPHFTSTPLKLETMKGLGLLPARSPHRPQNQFVNARRTYKKEKNESSPTKKKKPMRNKELRNLLTDTNEGKKIGETLVGLSNGRPTRRTKPMHLKEPNLKRKVRRS